MYGIYSKFIQVIYTLNTNCVSNIKILAPDISFTMPLMAEMPKSEKRHNSIKHSQNFTKYYSGHLHHVSKQCA